MKKHKPRIFISYSAKDMGIAEQLHQKLEAASFEVWAIKRVWRQIGYMKLHLLWRKANTK
jgi:hypothetical protein